MKVYDWPTAKHKYWWMQYKPKRKAFVALVTLVVIDGEECVQQCDGRNCYTRGCMEVARFIPCTSPPEFPPR